MNIILENAQRWSAEYQQRINDQLRRAFAMIRELAIPPAGGTAGQALTKSTDRDYEFVWSGETSFTVPTLLNSWAHYGAPFNTPGYYKDALGRVYLKGLVTGGTLPGTIFTLPAGYRPAAQVLFATISNSAIGRIDVDTSGNVVATLGSNAWITLDGLSFKAA